MDRCSEIKAHMKMEERYEFLSLVFGDRPELKQEILDVIESVKNETGQSPQIFDRVAENNPEIQSICLEFHDDVHREGGDFFNRVLKKLNIDKCESGI